MKALIESPHANRQCDPSWAADEPAHVSPFLMSWRLYMRSILATPLPLVGDGREGTGLGREPTKAAQLNDASIAWKSNFLTVMFNLSAKCAIRRFVPIADGLFELLVLSNRPIEDS